MDNKFDLTREELGDILATESGKAENSDIIATEEALLAFSAGYALTPPPTLKNKVLEKLNLLHKQSKERQQLDLHNLPLLQATSNWFDWKEVVKDIEPPDDFDDIYLHTLELNDTRELSIVWVREYVPEEIHENLLESFLILEGSCECEITAPNGNTRMVRLGEGDFITMQTGETHNIKITSQIPAKAILQWLKVA